MLASKRRMRSLVSKITMEGSLCNIIGLVVPRTCSGDLARWSQQYFLLLSHMSLSDIYGFQNQRTSNRWSMPAYPSNPVPWPWRYPKLGRWYRLADSRRCLYSGWRSCSVGSLQVNGSNTTIPAEYSGIKGQPTRDRKFRPANRGALRRASKHGRRVGVRER